MTTCHDCPRPAVIGSLCASCWVEVAAQALTVLDLLAELAPLAREHDHVIQLQPLDAGAWRVAIAAPAPAGRHRGEGPSLIDALGAALGLPT